MFYNRHIIKKQTLEFQAPDQKGARELQELVCHVYKTKVTPLLNKVCERYDQEDVVIQIENLEIDLGVLNEESITEELPNKIEALFEEELNKRIFYLGRKGFGGNTADKRLQVDKSELNSFLYFLQFGTFKWDGNPSGKKFTTLFDELFQSSKTELKKGLLSCLNQQNARKRLIYHLDQKQLKLVFSLLVSPKEYSESINLIDELKKVHRVNHFSKQSDTEFNLTIWDVAFYTVRQRKDGEELQTIIFNNLLGQISQFNGFVNKNNQQKIEAELIRAINLIKKQGGRINTNVLQEFVKSADLLSKKSDEIVYDNELLSDKADVFEESESSALNQQTTSKAEIESKSKKSPKEEKHQVSKNEVEGIDQQIGESQTSTKQLYDVNSEKNKEGSRKYSNVSKDSDEDFDNKPEEQEDRLIDEQRKNQSNQNAEEAIAAKYEQVKNEQQQTIANELKNSESLEVFKSEEFKDHKPEENSVENSSESVDQDARSTKDTSSKSQSSDKAIKASSGDTSTDQSIKSGKDKADDLTGKSASELLESKLGEQPSDFTHEPKDQKGEQSQIAEVKNDQTAKKSSVNSNSENSDIPIAESSEAGTKEKDLSRETSSVAGVQDFSQLKDDSELKRSLDAKDDLSAKDQATNTDIDENKQESPLRSDKVGQPQNPNESVAQSGKADSQSQVADDQTTQLYTDSDHQTEQNNDQSEWIDSVKPTEADAAKTELSNLDAGTSAKSNAKKEAKSEKINEAMALQKALREERTRERNGTQEQSNAFQASVRKVDQSNSIPWNAPTKPLEEAWINNAGLVLIWPFLPTLFKGLEWMEGNEFKSEELQHKAVWFLQFLVTGAVEADESELVLNKLLAGLKAETPVPAENHLSDEELKEGEHLLEVVIQNWSVLKGTSVDGFRATFLRKEGLMKKDFTGWKLHVERSTMDVLLEKLPWSYSVIKLPWVTEMIFVEW
ncbi:MAG: contractile injection system tape measure protein [Bacteroidota bacterium]